MRKVIIYNKVLTKSQDFWEFYSCKPKFSCIITAFWFAMITSLKAGISLFFIEKIIRLLYINDGILAALIIS